LIKYFNRRNFVFSLKFSTKANFSVALDTRGFNGHSSVADVIWSGVPIVRLYTFLLHTCCNFSNLFPCTEIVVKIVTHSMRRSLKHLPAPLVESEQRYCMHWENRAVSLVQEASKLAVIHFHVTVCSLLVERYLHLARLFANGGSVARNLRQKLKNLRIKKGGLYDTASWTVRFSKAVKM
jgi:hypothetical protein